MLVLHILLKAYSRFVYNKDPGTDPNLDGDDITAQGHDPSRRAYGHGTDPHWGDDDLSYQPRLEIVRSYDGTDPLKGDDDLVSVATGGTDPVQTDDDIV